MLHHSNNFKAQYAGAEALLQLQSLKKGWSSTHHKTRNARKLLELGCETLKQVWCENSGRKQQWTARLGWKLTLGSEVPLQSPGVGFVPGGSPQTLSKPESWQGRPGRKGNSLSKGGGGGR